MNLLAADMVCVGLRECDCSALFLGGVLFYTDCEIRASVFANQTAYTCLGMLDLRRTVKVNLIYILWAVFCAKPAFLTPFSVDFDFIHIYTTLAVHSLYSWLFL